jgi:aminoglycoside phosphotransferase (APT) family kinase protein
VEDRELQTFLAWAEGAVGGQLVRCERQGERRSGGRPAFFIDFARDGEEIRTYARMDRGDGQLINKAFGLDREYRVLVGLNEQGLRVPKIHGLCEAPRGILMENVPGAFDYTELSPGKTRDALDRDFLVELDKLHRIDPGFWVGIGLNEPKTPDEIALADLAVWERTYRVALRRPVPLVEFATRWLRRNVPAAPERIALIQGDTGPGQFIYEGAQLKAIIDWEFAHLADPVLDLAQIRTRDFYNPGGDMTAWMQTYADISGMPIDAPRLAYYTVKSMLITPLALAGVCQNMVAQTDHAEWYSQDVTYKRASAEALGEAVAITLRKPSSCSTRTCARNIGPPRPTATRSTASTWRCASHSTCATCRASGPASRCKRTRTAPTCWEPGRAAKPRAKRSFSSESRRRTATTTQRWWPTSTGDRSGRKPSGTGRWASAKARSSSLSRSDTGRARGIRCHRRASRCARPRSGSRTAPAARRRLRARRGACRAG